MISSLWIKAAPWLIAALMAAAAAVCLQLYMSERDDFTAYRSEVKAIGEAQQAQVEKDKKQHEENLKQVRKDYEDRLPAIRDNAIVNYRMRNPSSRVCSVSGDTTSKPVDDGAKPELMAADAEFIRSCAEDSAKVGAFQDYCKRNNCPIEE